MPARRAAIAPPIISSMISLAGSTSLMHAATCPISSGRSLMMSRGLTSSLFLMLSFACMSNILIVLIGRGM